MENIIDFPWYRAYESTPLSYAEIKLKQRELFFKRIHDQTEFIIAQLNFAKVKPDTICRVVDEESPTKTRYSGHCWIITEEEHLGLRPAGIGSNDPPIPFTSYRGLGLTPLNNIFEYGATGDNLSKGIVTHIEGRHLFNEIPDEYIEKGAIVSSELIRGLARLSLRAS